jgi:hypothetical protein
VASAHGRGKVVVVVSDPRECTLVMSNQVKAQSPGHYSIHRNSLEGNGRINKTKSVTNPRFSLSG